MKKSIYSIATAIIVTIFLTGCSAQIKLPKEDLAKTYYTQTNMWFRNSHTYDGNENNRMISDFSFYSVNYKYDKLIPVNTAIKIIRLGHNSIFFKIKNNNKIFAFNRTRQSRGKSLTQLFNRSFNTNMRNLNSYNTNTKKDIFDGRISIGMTKDEVIIARGFPPETKTKSLVNNTWYYWDQKRNKVRFEFRDDNLDRIDYY